MKKLHFIMKKFTASSRILFLFVIISIVLIEVNELRVEHMASDPQGEVQPVIRVLPGNPWINISSQVNVFDYGAKGDGEVDETDAFQKALNHMYEAQGGTVYVPRGLYRFNGNIVIPPAVTLEGVFKVVPSHSGIRNTATQMPNDGSILMPYVGAERINGTAFITMGSNSVLRGVVIYYPGQATTGIPIPYPFAISMTGNNPTVIDVELLNPYQGIAVVNAARHYVARVQGQPLFTGIFVDQTDDIGRIGRIEDVHWNPWFSTDPVLFGWQLQHGRAFVIAHSDSEYVQNTFAFGYNIGYHFTKGNTGSGNGNFMAIRADNCSTAVLVDAADQRGIFITNGEFASFEVVVSNNNTGKVQFVNTAFWGPGRQIVIVNGTGVVGFIGCTFRQWNDDKKGRYAIQAHGGTLIVQGSEFQQKAPQVKTCGELSSSEML